MNKDNKQAIHNFDIDDAIKYGVTKAIVLYTIKSWINYKNKIQHGLKKADNGEYYYFAYASCRALQKQMPYLGKTAINRALQFFVEEGVLISGIFNKSEWDKTKWYALKGTEIQVFDTENEGSPPVHNGVKPVPKEDVDETNTDDNTISFNISLKKPSLLRKEEVPYGNEKINQLFIEFEKIMGYPSNGRKKQDRYMAKHLLDHFTFDQLRAMLKYCATQEYAPRVGSIEKLWFKRGDVIAGIKSLQNKQNKEITLSV